MKHMYMQDPCHDLAWILDAAIAHSKDSPEQGALKAAHMASLKKFFQDLGTDKVCCLSERCTALITLCHTSAARI